MHDAAQGAVKGASLARRRWLARLVNSRCAAICALGIGLLSLVLWAISAHVYYRPIGPLAIAARLPGVLLQACSQRSALHLVIMRDDRKPEFALERLTYLGNAGYSHGAVAGGLGFVFALLPKTFDGGDYTVPPHLAVVIPYWFIVGLCGVVCCRWFFFLRNRSRK
jgi:predicted signal transduction protein with EAL and GGDEF domain